MFTGIVEEIGTLRRMKATSSSCTLTISCEKVLEGTKLGDSIAVNGTCLTVTRMDTYSFDCDVTPETPMKTLIKAVTELGAKIEVQEARNKVKVEAMFRRERQEHKEAKRSASMAKSYYQNMSKMSNEPQFMDAKQ